MDHPILTRMPDPVIVNEKIGYQEDYTVPVDNKVNKTKN